MRFGNVPTVFRRHKAILFAFAIFSGDIKTINRPCRRYGSVEGQNRNGGVGSELPRRKAAENATFGDDQTAFPLASGRRRSQGEGHVRVSEELRTPHQGTPRIVLAPSKFLRLICPAETLL